MPARPARQPHPAAAAPPQPDTAAPVSLWLCGVMAVAVVALQAVPVLAPAIAADAHLPPAFVGAYTSALWSAGLLATALTPMLLARHGPWLLAQACLALCAAGMLAALVGHPAALAVGALLIGFGHGIEGPMAAQLLALHVPVPRRPLWFSVKQTGVQIGALAASATLPAVAAWAGWRAAVLVAMVLAAAGAVALRGPRRHYAEAADGPVASPTPRASMLAALRAAPALRWLAVAAASFGAMQVCLNSFFVTFAVQERGASLVTAGAWLATAQAGGWAGRLLWGWLGSGRIATLPLIMGLGVGMAACSTALGLWGTALPALLLWPLLAAFGLTASGWNGVFLAEVARRVPVAQAGTATAAVLVVMMTGLIAGPLAFSALAATASFAHAFVAWGGVGAVGVLALAAARRAPAAATTGLRPVHLDEQEK